MTRKQWLLIVLLTVGLSILALRLFDHPMDFSSHSFVEAIGLKGASRISKRMTPLQQKRLEKHFTQLPAQPVDINIPSRNDAPSSMGTVHHINTVNQFNLKQNSYEKP